MLFWNCCCLDGLDGAGIAGINSFAGLAAFASPYAIGFIKDATGSAGYRHVLSRHLAFIGAFLVYLVPKQLVNK